MTKINAGLNIEEPSGGIRFGTDALLLAHFMLPSAGKRGLDLGTGSGVIPLLYLAVNRASEVTGIEIQPEYAAAAVRNARGNRLDGRFAVIEGDLREYKKLFVCGSFDFVFSNPPYHRAGSGRKSAAASRDTAFRENECGIGDILACAGFALKNGGRFFAVYRPERLSALFSAMRSAGIEPKRLRFVCPDAASRPSLLLVEGRRAGAEGLCVMPSLYMYSDASHLTASEECARIYDAFKG